MNDTALVTCPYCFEQLEVYVKGWMDTGRLIRLNTGRPGEMEPARVPLVGTLDPVGSGKRREHDGNRTTQPYPRHIS